MSEQQSPWDETIARTYVEKYGNHPSNHKTVQLAKLQVKDEVLDIGCGSGTAVFEAASVVKEGNLVGIDPSPTMVQIATEKLAHSPAASRIQFLEGSAENIPAEDNSFTVVMAINTFNHWMTAEQGVVEVKRVLGGNGRFLITEEQFDEDEIAWSPAQIAALLTKNGFQKIHQSTHALDDCDITFLEFRIKKPRDKSQG